MNVQCFKIFIPILFGLAIGMLACKKSAGPDPDAVTDPENLGWFGTDDMSTIPTNVTYLGNGNLPDKVDLVPKFPPVGDQGQYGTCVAWAVGYNYKTAVNGMDKGYSISQLTSPAYQFSAKYLFLDIPDGQKGANCEGTDIGVAFSNIQDKGIATVQTVPYTALGDCSQSNIQNSWVSEAGQHRIKYWRKVQADSPDDLKALLADNIPIAFGARLADNFMSWNSEAVLSSNSSYNNVGQHAYHAMVIAGYDNAKNAFKVINSWGKNWGANGYIWIEYNFFLNEFCQNNNGQKALFMAVNEGGGIAPPDDPDPVSSGVDLAAWVFDDYDDGYYQGSPKRVSDFNIYNIGNETASANKQWSVYYLAFNAYDANDYGVLFNCDVNTSVAYGTESCVNFNNCTYNVNIPSGSDLGYEFSNGSSFGFAYTMPNITGYYYLVAYVDPFDAFAETDETNNLFYPFDDPVYFTNGEGLQGGADDRSVGNSGLSFKNPLNPTPGNLRKNDHFSLLHKNHNAYRNEELATVIHASKQDGRWEKKIAEMRLRNAKK